MNIHEYQAKEIFRRYRLVVPDGKLVTSVDEATQAAKDLGGNIWVVKAQIHAGGRGKAGGVKLAKNMDCKNILNHLLHFLQKGDHANNAMYNQEFDKTNYIYKKKWGL